MEFYYTKQVDQRSFWDKFLDLPKNTVHGNNKNPYDVIKGFEVVEDIRKFFKEKVYNTIIPRLVRLTEAPSHGEPIIVYDPKSRGSEAYLNLAKEVISRNGNQ